MALKEELQAVDVADLGVVFNHLSDVLLQRGITEEPPIELFDLNDKYPVVDAIRRALRSTALTGKASERGATITANGGFMAMAALAKYADKYGSPHLESVRTDELQAISDGYNARIISLAPAEFGTEMKDLMREYPFVDRLIDLVLVDAMDMGVDLVASAFGNGALQAMGTLVTYAEAE